MSRPALFRGSAATRTLDIAVAASLALHALLVLALLPHTPGAGVVVTTEPATVEVEMVDQAAARKGAAAAPAGTPPPVPDAPKPPPQEAAQTAQPPPPSPQARAAPPAPPAPVNLLGTDDDRDPLLVTGDNVVPPRPDAAIRNRAPTYPAEAARRGHQGVVGLLIHVTEAGIPAWVDIRVSSGDTSLDEAARDAVALWRFRPAFNGRSPVPFDLAYNIHFTLSDSDRSLDGQDRPGYNPRR